MLAGDRQNPPDGTGNRRRASCRDRADNGLKTALRHGSRFTDRAVQAPDRDQDSDWAEVEFLDVGTMASTIRGAVSRPGEFVTMTLWTKLAQRCHAHQSCARKGTGASTAQLGISQDRALKLLRSG